MDIYRNPCKKTQKLTLAEAGATIANDLDPRAGLKKAQP